MSNLMVAVGVVIFVALVATDIIMIVVPSQCVQSKLVLLMLILAMLAVVSYHSTSTSETRTYTME